MMNGINLHAIARAAINRINPDEAVTLYQAVGAENIGGIVHTAYEASPARAQIQPIPDALRVIDNVQITGADCFAYLFSDATLPVAGQKRRPISRTGDVIKRTDGLYYLVTTVNEDYSPVGWVKVTLTEQARAPEGIIDLAVIGLTDCGTSAESIDNVINCGGADLPPPDIINA